MSTATRKQIWFVDGTAVPAGWMQRTFAWGFAVLFSVYLGLSGGGYDIIVRSEIGLIVWWFLLLGALLGLLPHARVPRAGWVATALLAGFLVWTWIGLSWSSSHELTLDEVCRVSTYLGFFLVALCTLSPETARSLVNGLGCGIAAVSATAIMSKLAPSLFPAGAAGTSFYETARLSYPFNYADGVGEYAALGLPLVLYIATGARTVLGRALGAAGLQCVLLCLAMTVSRGGILAAVIGGVAFFALASDRIPRLPTLAIAAAGIAASMVALLHRPALRDSLSAAPAAQRHSMILIFCVVLAATAIVQALAVLVMGRLERPGWLRFSRRAAQRITAAILVALVAVVIVAFAAGAVSKLWHDFKLWQPKTNSNEYFRLFSLAGSHRYQYWQIAWKAFGGSPFHGIGPGTFQFYWNQHATHVEKITNVHSLWFETLAETGVIGWLLLAGFFALTAIGGAVRALRSASAAHRTLIATSTASVFAFCAAASFDWIWQIGVVPMAMMLLAGVTFVPAGSPATAGERESDLAVRSRPARRIRLRPQMLLAPAAALCLVLIAIPLSSWIEVQASQSAARRGDLKLALADANTAQAIEPGAASPYLQQAFVLEAANEIPDARAAIKRAIAAEPDNYQLWQAASRLATESDHPRQAVLDWKKSLKLFPNFPVLYL